MVSWEHIIRGIYRNQESLPWRELNDEQALTEWKGKEEHFQAKDAS